MRLGPIWFEARKARTGDHRFIDACFEPRSRQTAKASTEIYPCQYAWVTNQVTWQGTSTLCARKPLNLEHPAAPGRSEDAWPLIRGANVIMGGSLGFYVTPKGATRPSGYVPDMCGASNHVSSLVFAQVLRLHGIPPIGPSITLTLTTEIFIAAIF